MRSLICILMAVLLTGAPNVAFAEAAGEMIPTMDVVDEMTRAEGESRINDLLSREEVQAELEKFGVSKDEISKRLATLSDSEIRQLTQQIDDARFGGEPLSGILIVVVLVLLIIFLAQRI